MGGGLKACLMGNHGICVIGANLKKALWLANEVECLSKQYVTASELGPPTILSNDEMNVILAKFKTYGKQPEDLKNMNAFDQEHAVIPPPRASEKGKLQNIQSVRRSSRSRGSDD